MKQLLENKNAKIICLGIIVVLAFIVVLLINKGSKSKELQVLERITETNLSTCASVGIDLGYVKINKTPLTREQALLEEPNHFVIKGECDELKGYNFYIAVAKDNKIDTTKVKYILTNKGSKEVIKEGVLGTLNSMNEAFSEDELKRYSKNIGSEVDKVYLIYNDFVPEGTKEYDLYVYIDRDLNNNAEINGSFIAGVGLKTYEIGE